MAPGTAAKENLFNEVGLILQGYKELGTEDVESHDVLQGFLFKLDQVYNKTLKDIDHDFQEMAKYYEAITDFESDQADSM